MANCESVTVMSNSSPRTTTTISSSCCDNNNNNKNKNNNDQSNNADGVVVVGSSTTISSTTNTSTSSTSTTTGIGSSSGRCNIAGRTNYGEWDKIAKDLIDEVDREDNNERMESDIAIGKRNRNNNRNNTMTSSSKYAYSQDHANEIKKAQKIQETKNQIEQYKQRDNVLRQTMIELLGRRPKDKEKYNISEEKDEGKEEEERNSNNNNNNNNDASKKKKIVRITRESMEAGKRVLTIADTWGTTITTSSTSTNTSNDNKTKKQQQPSSSSSMDMDMIVLTQDLNHLESKIPQQQQQPQMKAKSYPDDAENDVVAETVTKDSSQVVSSSSSSSSTSNSSSIYGLIKLFINNVHNCIIVIRCKLITGMIEMNHCSNVILRIQSKTAMVATIQIDLSHDITVEFINAPSGGIRTKQQQQQQLRNNAASSSSTNSPISVMMQQMQMQQQQQQPQQQQRNTISSSYYWGDDPDDRIYHAGVSNLCVRSIRDDDHHHHHNDHDHNDDMISLLEHVADYIRDGAIRIGNATPEEYPFVTSMINGKLITEPIVRNQQHFGANAANRANAVDNDNNHGGTTTSSARPMTKRELEQEKIRREHAKSKTIQMAENMIQIKDKNGNIIEKKTNHKSNKSNKKEEAKEEDKEKVVVVDDEIYNTSSISKGEMDAIINTCEQHKTDGNKAFVAGEYGQAILNYTLALDKAQELPDSTTTTNTTTSTSTTDSSLPSSSSSQSLFPRDILYSNRSACFLKLGQHEKAIQDAKQCIEINSSNIKGYFRCGLAYHAMKQYEMAIPYLVRAHHMEPKNKQIKQALTFCEVHIQQQIRKRMDG